MKADEEQAARAIAGPRSGDPLAAVKVFDRLEVGPVKLERKRLIAPYRLTSAGKTEEPELICSYEVSGVSPASGRRGVQFNPIGDFMKMTLDFMKFHIRCQPVLARWTRINLTNL